MADVPPEEGADGSPRVAEIPVASSTHSSESGGDGGSRTSIGTKAFDVVMIKDPKSASGESSSSNHAGGGVGGGCDSIGRNSSGDDMDIDGDKAKEPTTTTGTPKGPSIPTQGGPAWGEYDPDECFICFDGGEIILCDYCNRSYRLQCHRPPLKEVPEGKFKCMECVAVSSWGVGSSPSRPTATGDGVSDKGKKRAQSDAPNFVDPSEAAKYIGTRIAKVFDGEVYFGSITQYNKKTQFWHVVYDDDDEEDYDPRDLEEAGKLYRKERKRDDPNKSRGSQQRYFRIYKVEKAPAPPKQKKKKVGKPTSARPPSRSQSPIAQKLPPKYCVIQVPKEVRPGDIIDVVFPGDEFTSQIVCPDFAQHSPFVTVVAPGGYQPPSAPIDYARANADRLCDGLPTDKSRPFVVEAFNCTLWPALKAHGWKRLDVHETGTGLTQFIPPGNRYSLSDSAGRLGLGYCTSYQGVISFCADTEEYKELHAAFEIDIIARKQRAERLEQMARDNHYLSSQQHDTPIGPDHQVSNFPKLREREEYLFVENRRHLRRERPRVSWNHKFVNIATNDFLKKLATQNRAEYDLEAVMEVFSSFNYNDIAARAVITMPVPPDESWRIGVNEKEFEVKLKSSNHDLKKVADALGLNLIKCLWYYYHCYRPCRQWDFERDKEAFHDALLKARGNLHKAAVILGKRYDSCLWFYDSKYRFSPLHKEYKAVEERWNQSCAICEDSGGNLLLCSECPKSYHASCLSLEENDGVEDEWICPACNPGFPCPNCSKRFRRESGLKNHLRRCDASAMTDSDNSRRDQEADDDSSAPENSGVQEDESMPSDLPLMSSFPVSGTSEKKRTAGLSTPVALNPSIRLPAGQFPVPQVRNFSISGTLATNKRKEIEAINPATMARLRLFPSISDAARMSKINRTTLSKACKEGGGIIEGIFYRFTSDGAKTKESNQSDLPRKFKICFRPDDSDNLNFNGKDLVDKKERDWAAIDAKRASMDAEIKAGRPLAFFEEQKRLKENAAVAAAAAAAAPTGNTSEIKDAGTSTPPNDVGLGGPSDEVDGLI